VIAVVYEGRPNVTADAVALALKSGNAVILRGSHLAMRSNLIIAEVLTGALIEADAPRWAVALLGADREELRRLVEMEDAVDLVIPRGGPQLKALLREHARVPVIYAAAGNNHVYVHADADPEMAVKIAVNAKVQRPGVCNAAETLLVHRDAAPAILPLAVERLRANGVELRMDRAGRDLLGDAAEGLGEATEQDYDTEYLDLVMAVRVVADLDEAIDHIARHGSGHSEAIVTESLAAARAFQERVDAAVVYVNASTRFTDGGEFGMGAEIGISTQKLHARGPIGLAELTSYTYLVTGHGHLR
jgi:glutamate-5-semialdehyde dehydrogenase